MSTKQVTSTVELAKLKREGWRIVTAVRKDGQTVWLVHKDEKHTTKAVGECR